VKNATKIGDKTCLIQLENTTDKIAIMKNKRNLKDEKIYINEDWSRWEREIQTTIRTIAKEEEMKGSSRRADNEEWKWDPCKKELKPPKQEIKN
jgi:hypothetical protein